MFKTVIEVAPDKVADTAEVPRRQIRSFPHGHGSRIVWLKAMFGTFACAQLRFWRYDAEGGTELRGSCGLSEFRREETSEDQEEGPRLITKGLVSLPISCPLCLCN